MTIGEVLRASPALLRKKNGNLYELTPAQKKRCDELIRKECFMYRDGNCLYLEDWNGPSTCAQRNAYHVECRWFQNALLPLEWKLERDIFHTGEYGRCVNCGQEYKKTNGHMKYCAYCRIQVRKDKKKQYEAERRARIRGRRGQLEE